MVAVLDPLAPVSTAPVYAAPADFGLGRNALPNAMAQALHADGTDVAVCNVGARNPAHSLAGC